MPFARLVNAILNELNSSRTVRPGRNYRVKDKHQLSIDLALVGFRLRTAHLVDAFTPSDHVSFWQELLEKLRSSSLTSFAFASVVHVFEPYSEQSFIVNVSMVPQLLLGLASGSNQESDQSNCPVFVQISRQQTFQLLDALPLPLFRLLDSLHQCLSPSLSNPEAPPPLTHTLPDLPPSLAVPLAAILLDFSVVYIPESAATSSGSANSSSGVLLHFFECILSYREVEEAEAENVSAKVENQKIGHDNMKSCTVMKFSCPASIQISLLPDKIISHLDDLFTKRLISIGDPTLLKVEIQQTTHTLDQLVL